MAEANVRNRALIDRIKDVYVRISRAAMRAGRDPEGIRLVAVTKTVDTTVIYGAVEAGLREFGENRVQEAREKIPEIESMVPDSLITWHLVGHLQKNKAKTAVDLFDLIHSVDSVELAVALNEQAARIGKIQRILVQVKLSDEATKHGIARENLLGCLEKLVAMKNLKTEGLMTIPPFFDDPRMVRPYFSQLREIRDGIASRGLALGELSMGMTNDFEVAVEEGATIVRVGTAIFGEREKEEK